MSVYFKCKSCDGEHRSPASFVDRASFDACAMPETLLRCHSTGRTTTYARQDMYWCAEGDAPEEEFAPVALQAE